MDEQQATAPLIRPYFVPAGIDFETLPDAVKAVFTEFVEPNYRELVLGATTPLERTAGATLTFLSALEVLDQVELGRDMHLAGAPAEKDTAERDKAMVRHLRLVSSKQRAESFLLRVSTLRAKNGFFEGPLA